MFCKRSRKFKLCHFCHLISKSVASKGVSPEFVTYPSIQFFLDPFHPFNQTLPGFHTFDKNLWSWSHFKEYEVPAISRICTN